MKNVKEGGDAKDYRETKTVKRREVLSLSSLSSPISLTKFKKMDVTLVAYPGVSYETI